MKVHLAKAADAWQDLLINPFTRNTNIATFASSCAFVGGYFERFSSYGSEVPFGRIAKFRLHLRLTEIARSRAGPGAFPHASGLVTPFASHRDRELTAGDNRYSRGPPCTARLISFRHGAIVAVIWDLRPARRISCMSNS